MSGASYFVTWRLHAGQADLTPDEKTAVVRAIEHFNSPGRARRPAPPTL